MDFEVESYLQHQGEVFTRRFDANTYLYITKALDYFDLAAADGTLVEAFADVPVRRPVSSSIAFSSDWLYPPYQSKEIVRALKGNGLDCTYLEINSSFGHDAFLVETDQQTHADQHLPRRTARPAGGQGVRACLTRIAPAAPVSTIARNQLGERLDHLFIVTSGGTRARGCSTWAAAGARC